MARPAPVAGIAYEGHVISLTILDGWLKPDKPISKASSVTIPIAATTPVGVISRHRNLIDNMLALTAAFI